MPAPLRLKTRWPELTEDERDAWLKQASAAKSGAEGPAPEPSASAPSTADVKRRRTMASSISTMLSDQASPAEAAKLLCDAIKKFEASSPGFSNLLVHELQKQEPALRQCAACSTLLTGLFSLPGFDAPYPSEKVHNIRHSVDRLVRTTFEAQDQVRQLGYNIGVKRWQQADFDTPPERQKRGQPSQVNNSENVARVKELLDHFSQPSSTPVLNKDKEWVLAQSLTRRRNTLFEENPAVNNNMSAKVFYKILREHFREYKRPRLLTDYCQICNDYDEKVLGKLAKLLEASRAELEAHLPAYFQAWDFYAGDKDYSSRPALHVHDLEHFIRRHDRSTPCAAHRNTDFPCGQASVRQRCADILNLREVEIHRGIELRAMDRLVAAYNYHRASNEHQKPAIDAMLQLPVLGRLSLICDWAELQTLPLLPKQTDTSFYGTARKELAIFGCCLTEHGATSTAEKPMLHKQFLIFISDILDHTACRSTTLLERAIACRISKRKLEGIDFISDCAGHFRSYETCYWALIDQVKKHQCEIAWHWGVEKHLKHQCDRLFGWWRQGLRSVMENQISITEVDQLQAVMQQHFDRARVRDKTSPLVQIFVENDTPVPTKIYKLEISGDFRISRTYCLSSKPNKYATIQATISNHVYSTRPTSERLHVSSIAELEGPGSWRRGFFGKGAEQWQTDPQPLAAGESNHLSRRMDAQCAHLPDHRKRIHGRYNFDKAMAQVRKAQRRRQRRRQLNQSSSSSDSSSDSQDSSSSSQRN